MPLRILRKNDRELSDGELLARFNGGGDLKALGELYSRYMHLVYGVCLKYLRNREESRDAVMNIFEKMASEPGKHSPDNFRAWLYVVTRNHCLMKLRSAAADRSKFEEWATDNEIFMESEAILHPVDREGIETDTALRECIEKLTGLQKESIELFYFKNKCYREIAERLGADEKKVKSLLQNGKRNLKICLEGKNVRY
jgi:RNA polymerase sigma-70 factor (ECF subfamily)